MAIYQIADLRVHMETFGRTLEQAKPYLVSDAQADIEIVSNPEPLQKRNPHLSHDDCEYLSTGADFYRKLTEFNGMMLHASCVVVDNRAYLFSAPCGTGKSTHVSLWLELFGDRAYVLNDDKPAIRVLDDDIFVYGTPWSGKNDYSRNERVPLGGIAFVRRAEENSIRPMETDKAVYAMLDQTARSIASGRMIACLDTINCIIETGRVWELFCNMDISAARLSYETMCEKRASE